MTVSDLGWPQMTFREVGNEIFTRIVNNYPILYDSTQISLRQSKNNGVNFSQIDL